MHHQNGKSMFVPNWLSIIDVRCHQCQHVMNSGLKKEFDTLNFIPHSNIILSGKNWFDNFSKGKDLQRWVVLAGSEGKGLLLCRNRQQEWTWIVVCESFILFWLQIQLSIPSRGIKSATRASLDLHAPMGFVKPYVPQTTKLERSH